MANVRMPNGDVVAFPDGMADTQIKGLIQQKFPEAGMNDLGRSLVWGARAADSLISPWLQIPEASQKWTGSALTFFGEMMGGEGMVGTRGEYRPPRQDEHPFTVLGEDLYRDAIKELQETQPDLRDDPVLKTMNEVSTVVRDMGPALAASIPLGPWAVIPVMGVQVALGMYKARRDAGETPTQAAIGSGIHGTIEGVTEHPVFKWGLQPGKTLSKRALDMFVGEGLQEGASAALGGAYDWMTIAKDKTFSEYLKDIGHEAMIGALAGPTLAGIMHPFVPSQKTVAGKELLKEIEKATPEQIEYNMSLLGMGPQQDIEAGPKFPTPNIEAGFKSLVQGQVDMFAGQPELAGEYEDSLLYQGDEDQLKALAPIMPDIERLESADPLMVEVMRVRRGITEEFTPRTRGVLEKVARDLKELHQRMARAEEQNRENPKLAVYGASHKIRDPGVYNPTAPMVQANPLPDGGYQYEVWLPNDEYGEEYEHDRVATFPTAAQAITYARMIDEAPEYKPTIPAGKEPWQLTRDEYVGDKKGKEAEIAYAQHRAAIKRRILEPQAPVDTTEYDRRIAELEGEKDILGAKHSQRRLDVGATLSTDENNRMREEMFDMIGQIERAKREKAKYVEEQGRGEVSRKVLEDYPDLQKFAIEEEIKAAEPARAKELMEEYPDIAAKMLPMMATQAGNKSWSESTWLKDIQLDVKPVMDIKVPLVREIDAEVDDLPYFEVNNHNNEMQTQMGHMDGLYAYHIVKPTKKEKRAMTMGLNVLAKMGLNPNAYTFTLTGLHTVDTIPQLHGQHIHATTRDAPIPIGATEQEQRANPLKRTYHITVNRYASADMSVRSSWTNSGNRAAYLGILAHEIGHHVDRGLGHKPGERLSSSEVSPLFGINLINGNWEFGSVMREAIQAYITDRLGLRRFLGYPLNSFADMRMLIDDIELRGGDPVAALETRSESINAIKNELFAQLHSLFYLYYTTPENAAKLDAVFPQAMRLFKELDNAHYIPDPAARSAVIDSAIRGEVWASTAAAPLAGYGAVGDRSVGIKSLIGEQADRGMGARGVLQRQVQGQLGQDVINSPAFREWFGDSKVVDEAGRPMVVYRGVSAGRIDETRFGRVQTFTPERYVAADYAGDYEDGFVGAYYLSLQNPVDLDTGEDVISAKDLRELIGEVRPGEEELIAEMVARASNWRGWPESPMDSYYGAPGPETLDEIPDDGYTDTFEIADSEGFKQLMISRGYDGIIIRGPFNPAYPNQDIPEGLFDRLEYEGEVEYRTFSEDQVWSAFTGKPIAMGEALVQMQIIPPSESSTFTSGQAGWTMDQMYANAQAHQDELTEVAERAAEKIGGVFVNPGIKSRDTAAEKLGRNGYKNPGGITDIVRGGFVLETPYLADPIIEELGKRFDVLDEGLTVTKQGYVDRKMLIRFKDGEIGELQMWSPEMARAKFGPGEKNYEEVRAISHKVNGVMVPLPGREADFDALNEEAKDLYSDALAQSMPWALAAGPFLEKDYFNMVLAKSGNSVLLKKARKSSRLTREAERSKARLSARVQVELPGFKAQAEPSAISTAGRPSQRAKVLTDSSGNIVSSVAGSTVPILLGQETLDVKRTGKSKVPTNVDVANALEARVSAPVDPAEYSSRNQENPDKFDRLMQIEINIARVLTEEIRYQLSRDDHAGTWYDDNIREMKRLASQYLHPEIAEDQNMDMMFTAILALTSNGERVESNFAVANRIYSYWKETGKFPERFGHPREETVRASLESLTTMIEQKGMDWVREFLITPRPIRETKQILKDEFGVTWDPGSTSVEDIKTGSVVFGPKIGSFYANMMGDFDQLTADQWFARTWNRIIGRMMTGDSKPETMIERRNTIRRHIIDGTAELRVTSLVGPMPFDLDQVYSDDRVMDEYAEYVNRLIQREYSAPYMKRRGLKKRTSAMESKFEKALKNLAKANTVALQLDPRNGAERTFMARAMRRAIQDMDVSMASAQALLWYHEKTLYALLKGQMTHEDAQLQEDYVAAITQIIGFENLTQADQRRLAGYDPNRGGGSVIEGVQRLYVPTEEEVKVANDTSRGAGAVGAKALVPRYVERIATPEDTILDFGAGREAQHAKALRENGLNVTAHDFGRNQNQNHDPEALTRKYSIVYASNVLNTESSEKMLREAVRQIAGATERDGRAVVNFPQSPRKMEMDAIRLREILLEFYDRVNRVGGTPQAPVWELSAPKRPDLSLYSNPFQAIMRGYGDVAETAIRWGENVLAPINALGKVPQRDIYMEERYRYMGRIGRINRMAERLEDTFSELDAETARAVYEYLTDPAGTVDSIPDVTIRRKEKGREVDISIRSRAKALKRLFNEIGDALVDAMLIPEESRDKFRDRYLPRVYLKHVLGGTPGIRGARLSRGERYKKRGDIPEAWRRIMGEITDPAYLASMGVTIPLRDLETIRFLQDIALNRNWVHPNYVVPLKTDTASGQVRASIGGPKDKAVSVFWLEAEANRLRDQARHMEGTARAETEQYANDLKDIFDQVMQNIPSVDTSNFTQVPNTKQYGALRGMYLHKQIYDDLFPSGQRTGYTKLEDVVRYWKVLKVPLNYPTVVRNLMSNVILMHMGGVPLHHIPIRLRQALHEMGNNGPAWRVAQKMGIGESTFTTQELMTMERNWIRLMARNDISAEEGLPLWKIYNFFEAFVGAHTNFYQGSEAVFKTAIIIDRMKAGANEVDAAMAANEALFDYSLLPRWAEITRRNALGVPFLTFYYKASGQALKAAIRRPHLVLGYYLFWQALQELTMSAFDDLDDDDLETLMQALPRWLRERGHAWFVPWKDEHGRWQALDVGYILPWAAHAQTLRNLAEGKPLEALEELGFLGTPIATLISAAMTRKDPFTQQEIWSEYDPAPVQAKNMFKFIWRLAMPTYLTDMGLLGHTHRALTDQKDVRRAYYGQPTSTLPQALLRGVGINMYPVDPESTRVANLLSYRREILEIKSRLSRRLKNPNLTIEERQEIRNQYFEMILEKQAEMVEYVNKSRIPDELKTRR